MLLLLKTAYVATYFAVIMVLSYGTLSKTLKSVYAMTSFFYIYYVVYSCLYVFLLQFQENKHLISLKKTYIYMPHQCCTFTPSNNNTSTTFTTLQLLRNKYHCNQYNNYKDTQYHLPFHHIFSASTLTSINKFFSTFRRFFFTLLSTRSSSTTLCFSSR